MSFNNNSDKSFTNDSTDGSDRKTASDWIRFDERQNANDIQIEIASESNGQSNGQSSCATIEPTDSIQINVTNDHIKRNSSSPVSKLDNILPQSPTINANIMSNVESNKIVEKSFITNNNIESRGINGESSNASNVKTLQNVSLKEVNTDVQTIECNHTTCPPNNGFCETTLILKYFIEIQ